MIRSLWKKIARRRLYLEDGRRLSHIIRAALKRLTKKEIEDETSGG